VCQTGGWSVTDEVFRGEIGMYILGVGVLRGD
jgi:hypothetical protein